MPGGFHGYTGPAFTIHDENDLWETAYRSLKHEERSILDAIRNENASAMAISAVLEDIITTIETQFEIREKRNDTSKIRKAAKHILDIACSTQSSVASIAAADPISHAATAWAIVSLGLKVNMILDILKMIQS
ncbi:uncharacterized protein N7483_010158 [Penicillium malachiteum]|uniref:uncharacterized protein n=1 Tax=Penicillium malachiteum TaxID=1324776 RepID=UPI00254773EC|nr:uncharacterized protein N7483_010158 [Penicillium malachiteum]KAJ5712977.1 hypothetical protein N7483_010158 [Penicillium malachiteum]